MKTYYTISEIKEANKVRGHHFFDVSTMKFFKSKVYPEIIHGSVFITSEKFNSETPRLFSVRCAFSDGSISDLSKFQAFKTKQQAIRWARNLPSHIQQAMECVQNEFNTGKKSGKGFLELALMEPIKNKDHSFSLRSFNGACTWLLVNWKDTSLTHLEGYYKKFEARLQGDWLPVPTNADIKN